MLTGYIDTEDEQSILEAVRSIANDTPLDLIIDATGMLHDDELRPEKSLRDLAADKFIRVFMANTIGPALVAKHFLTRINPDRRVVFAALSARVGSISDNHLGGWYAYRAS